MNVARYALLLSLLLAAPASAAEIRAVALFKDRALLAIDGRQHLLKAGETSPEGITLLHSNSRRAVIRFNGQERALEVGTEKITGTFAEREAGRLRLYPDTLGHYLTRGHINGVDVNFLVDTGATYISMDADEARRIGIDYTRGEPGFSQTAAGRVPVYVLLLDRVGIGAVEQRNIRAAIHPNGGTGRTILLGNSFLNRFTLRRDSDYLELIEK